MTDPVVVRHGPGVARIEVPLPLVGLPFVNVYVLEGARGVTLIDCGTATKEGFEAIRAGLSILGHALTDVRQVIGTHLHVDHMALAGRLVRETGCDFVMHRVAEQRLDRYNDWSLGFAQLLRLAERHGASSAELQALDALTVRPDWAAEGIPPTAPVDDGGSIGIDRHRSLEVIHTPGHDPAHICLVDSGTGLVFSGDHVLPRISPVVLVSSDGSDALAEYLGSLRRIIELDARTTLPAHGPVIPRGSDRARQILLHHRRRLDEILHLTSEQQMSGWALTRAMFRPNLDVFHQRLAFGEILAHTQHLLATGRLAELEVDGIVTYRATPR